ncbi:MAG: ABC transporter ATP-binding protein/permease [Bacilli bacterium]|nr:ABC transporter ATP-binding protein/permease [Bacilli bacterium]
MLELKNITKVYEVADQKQKALNKVSIKFRKSEFVSILGPSGSGKTTLLNIIGGLDKYTEGNLIINGVSTKEYTDRDWDTYRNHRVGFVFQTYNLIPHQTALQNVELALTLSGISKEERRQRAIEVLKSVGLASQINKRPNQMSGGQMQRVAIARALVNDPDILLADEPTGALDSETSLQIMDILEEIAKDRLVIMVTHNPEIAVNYSTRIVKLLDGEITDDSNPFDGQAEEESFTDKHHKSKKTYMNFKTAFGLSLNNLMTKKGRTLLTAFAGSIGIIGIALILSLSHGINKFIDRTEEETLSQYPLVIQKESVDMASLLQTFATSQEGEEHDDNKIHVTPIMGDLFETMSQKVKRNDMKDFKKYIESGKTDIKDKTSAIEYGYEVTMNLYAADTDKVVRVNPTTVLDVLGFNASGVASVYGSYLSNYDVFASMIGNDDLMKQQYDVVEGRWPSKYNEVVITVNENNEISDYTLYSLGFLDQEELKTKFAELISGKDVKFEFRSYDPKEIVGTKFKLLLNTDYYSKVNGVWLNHEDDQSYMKKVLKDAEEIEIVGIIKPNSNGLGSGNSYGLVLYKHELMEHLITKINESEIAKEQLANPEFNVLTGTDFSVTTFDMSNLTPEQIQAFKKMSQEELAAYMKAYSAGAGSYEENLRKLGIADLDNPDYIYLYPKNFEAKEDITDIIAKYNEGKDENEQLEYTDIVGIMMKSVTKIVNVISKVLIAFVAISLIVSSIMIAIITYISVIERTKEIGILRAIGASKKDISRVFNAETLIEGLTAGVMGIVVTLLLNIPINIIIKATTNIRNLAVLPFDGALILIIISVLLTIIAGFIPAKIASKKDPVEALRTE